MHTDRAHVKVARRMTFAGATECVVLGCAARRRPSASYSLNPGRKPQLADNVDFKLEFYFGNNGAGMFSVRAYRKNITGYIGSATRSGELVAAGLDNGFDGLYDGYEIIRSANLGDAKLRSMEIDMKSTTVNGCRSSPAR